MNCWPADTVQKRGGEEKEPPPPPSPLSFLCRLCLSAAVGVGNLEGSVAAVGAVAVPRNDTVGTAVVDGVEEDGAAGGVLAGGGGGGGESGLVVACWCLRVSRELYIMAHKPGRGHTELSVGERPAAHVVGGVAGLDEGGLGAGDGGGEGHNDGGELGHFEWKWVSR